ncbi:hypothetical protein DFH07DRAFT_29645 [Mycena maculata]|uniref:F-box domain-containing protein n=1 Tax=Mycena maculata TaxID=230809 RepID=A0AAD7NVJ3_9AGAR|nr:hypothetical protein DFH07DRAFT_29645 [Mycena maculata]
MDPTMALLMRQNSASRGFETHAKGLIKASEETIADIDSQMQNLARLRDRERGILAILCNAIVPANKLCAELLVEIFLFLAMPRPGQSTLESTAASIAAILTVSQVSAYWRKIATAAPRLWTNFFHLQLKTRPTDAYLTALTWWLDRSSPLSIRVTVKSDLPPHDIAPLIHTLLRGASRWSDLTLQIRSLACLPATIPHSLDKLTEVRISVHYGSLEKRSTFLNALSLRKAALNTDDLALLPWKHLTKLSLTTSSAVHCLEVLDRCMNLKRAELSFYPFRTGEPAAVPLKPSTVIPSLECIWLYFADTPSAPVLRHLTLPNLKSLRIGHSLRGRPSEWPTAMFTQFQQRSPFITRIELVSVQIASAEFITMLRNLPLLQSLSTWNCRHCIDDAFLQALRYQDSDLSPLVPALTSLSLREVGCSFHRSNLEKTIRSRWWLDEELHSVPSERRPRVERWECVSITVGETARRFLSRRFLARMESCRLQGLSLYLK